MNETKAPIDTALAAGSRPDPRRDPRMLTDSRRVEIPVDHNPGTVRGEGPSADAARGAMTIVWDAWQAVRDAALDPNTDLPELARVSQRAVERGLSATDRAADTIRSQIAHHDQQITAAVQPPIHDTLAAEMRTYWRDRVSGHAGRMSELLTAAGEDSRTSSAVLSGPGYLSGLTDARQRQMVHDAAVNAHAPEYQAARVEAERALAKVETAAERVTQTLGPRIRMWRDPEPTALRQLRSMADD